MVGRTNVGGGGNVYAWIAVTYPVGSTLTVTKGSKVLTAGGTTGTWVFKIPEAGTWTVTSTLGSDTETKAVSITEKGQIISLSLNYLPLISTTPVAGVSYTDGLSNLTYSYIGKIAEAISLSALINSETSELYSDEGDVHRRISVGDVISVAINTENYSYQIIGFNHDDVSSSEKAGITFYQEKVSTETYKMLDSRTTATWNLSRMKNDVLPNILLSFPLELRNLIKTVKKETADKGGSGATLIETYDNLFLLSEVETTGTALDSLAGEGSQYAFYKAGNAKWKEKNGTTTKTRYALRSPRKSGEIQYRTIETSGNADYMWSDEPKNIAIAFCL